MPVRVMATDGGVHPPDKWAANTAESIGDLIEVKENSDSPNAVAARKAKPRLILNIADVMEDFHANLAKRERAKLAAGGDEALLTPLDPNDGIIDTLDEAVAAIVKAASSTPFEAHFALPEVQAVVRGIVERDFVLAMDIERSWYADARAGSATVQRYRALRAAHGSRDLHQHAGGAPSLATSRPGRASA